MTREHPALEFFYALLDGDVSEAEARVARSHMEICPACRGTYREIEAIGQALTADPAPAVVVSPAKVMAAITAAERPPVKLTYGYVATAAGLLFVQALFWPLIPKSFAGWVQGFVSLAGLGKGLLVFVQDLLESVFHLFPAPILFATLLSLVVGTALIVLLVAQPFPAREKFKGGYV